MGRLLGRPLLPKMRSRKSDLPPAPEKSRRTSVFFTASCHRMIVALTSLSRRGNSRSK